MKTGLDFFIFKVRLAFIKLKQIFIKILIFYYFNLEYYIWTKINISKYVIDEILNQLTLNNLGQ